ncbi:MAG: hypothetical protein NT141_02435 [candidate division WWE3 bacterium]|nr:hypothetical protein [candidate division WWE3 bacterium]
MADKAYKEVQFDFKDKDGRRYIFDKENFSNHLLKHPELLREDFTERIKKAIIEPTCIYPAYKSKGLFCYYYEEFTFEGTTRYTKVVVRKTKYCYIIITAFRPTNIKETQYFKEPLWERP